MSDTAGGPRGSADLLPQGSSERSLPGDRSRVPTLAYAAVVVASVPFWFWMGRHQWFFLDEWNVLTDRDGGSLSSLLHSHNEHWVTVPIVVYRVLWNVVGLHHYWPYQAMAILGHAAVAILLFAIMRRVAVNPWLAAAAGSLFVFFGSGSQNIVWAFQIAFVWAMAFGLLQLYLADHDGPVDWRDFGAVASGLIALMCSGVGLTMLIAVGIGILLRRGWRRAALQVVPLVVVYGLWYSAYGRGQGNPANSPTAGQIADFVVSGLRASYRELGQLPAVGLVFVALTVVGFVQLWRSGGIRKLLTTQAVPIALLACSVAFLFSAAATRAGVIGSDASGSRYLYVVAGLSIPALATAVDALARRWSVVFPLGLLVLVLPVPWSIARYHYAANALGDPTVVVVPDVPGAADLPPDTALDFRGEGSGNFTVGWLRQADADGKLPELGPEARRAAEIDWRTRLALRQERRVAGGTCAPVGQGVELQLAEGASIGIAGGPLQVVNGVQGGSVWNAVTYAPELGATLVAQLPDVPLRLRSADPNRPASVCR